MHLPPPHSSLSALSPLPSPSHSPFSLISLYLASSLLLLSFLSPPPLLTLSSLLSIPFYFLSITCLPSFSPFHSSTGSQVSLPLYLFLYSSILCLPFFIFFCILIFIIMLSFLLPFSTLLHCLSYFLSPSTVSPLSHSLSFSLPLSTFLSITRFPFSLFLTFSPALSRSSLLPNETRETE